MAGLQADKSAVNGSQDASLKSRSGESARVAPNVSRERQLYEVKSRLHRSLVERLDSAQLELMESNAVAVEIRRAVSLLLAEDPFPLNTEERARLTQDLEFEILGLGPLEPLVRDDTISDILVNRFDEVFIERNGLMLSLIHI